MYIFKCKIFESQYLHNVKTSKCRNHNRSHEQHEQRFCEQKNYHRSNVNKKDVRHITKGRKYTIKMKKKSLFDKTYWI